MHEDIYSRVKVALRGKVGSQTKNLNSNYTDGDNREFYSIYLELSYPLLDKKTEIDMKNKALQYNLSIMQKVEDCAKAYMNYHAELNKLHYLRMKYKSLKGEYITGIKGRDERFQILEKLQQAHINIAKFKVEYISMREYLLQLTTNKKGLIALLPLENK